MVSKKKKVIPKKSSHNFFSNTSVAIVLVVAILVSVIGTVVVMENLSSAGKTIEIVTDSSTGTIGLNVVGQSAPPVPVELAFESGTIGMTVTKPNLKDEVK